MDRKVFEIASFAKCGCVKFCDDQVTPSGIEVAIEREPERAYYKGMNLSHYLPRSLPDELSGLVVLSLDLRWSWNHSADALWEMVDPEMWRASGNPWLIFSSVSQKRLGELARDSNFLAELRQQLATRDQYLAEPTWFAQSCRGLVRDDRLFRYGVRP